MEIFVALQEGEDDVFRGRSRKFYFLGGTRPILPSPFKGVSTSSQSSLFVIWKTGKLISRILVNCFLVENEWIFEVFGSSPANWRKNVWKMAWKENRRETPKEKMKLWQQATILKVPSLSLAFLARYASYVQNKEEKLKRPNYHSAKNGC